MRSQIKGERSAVMRHPITVGNQTIVVDTIVV